MTTSFHGCFSAYLQDFVDFKRSLGFKYQKECFHLRDFDAFCVREKITEPVLTKELSDRWCQKRPYEQERPGTQQRITGLRQFALYLVSIGIQAYIPVHLENKKSRKSKYVAYIFTHEEMARIFEKSDCVYPNRRSTLHLVMPVLVRLLYSTGMRVMEALNLQMKHVDFQDGTLHLEHAKFDKDRLLPLSPSMADILRRYGDVMHPRSLPDDFLFVGVTREPYTHHAIYLRFRELLLQAHIPHAGRGNGPRIHDIRHTFACHTLTEAGKRNIDLTSALPLISAYMGHKSMGATSQYLRMTAEVYPEMMDAVNRVCSFIIPGADR
jgi:integrase